MNFRKFIFSDDIFSYFECMIDLDELDSMEDIVHEATHILKSKLQELKMNCLISKLDTKKFHIHDKTFESILLSEPNQIYYICGHH